MKSITIKIQAETERLLQDKAEQGGQTLENYLENLIEQEIHRGNGTPVIGSDADEEFGERPWRGVFVLPRPRNTLFTQELTTQVDQLPRRKPSLNMNWHRTVTNDE
jgi:hypothetical protein